MPSLSQQEQRHHLQVGNTLSEYRPAMPAKRTQMTQLPVMTRPPNATSPNLSEQYTWTHFMPSIETKHPGTMSKKTASPLLPHALHQANRNSDTTCKPTSPLKTQCRNIGDNCYPHCNILTCCKPCGLSAKNPAKQDRKKMDTGQSPNP